MKKKNKKKKKKKKQESSCSSDSEDSEDSFFEIMSQAIDNTKMDNPVTEQLKELEDLQRQLNELRKSPDREEEDLFEEIPEVKKKNSNFFTDFPTFNFFSRSDLKPMARTTTTATTERMTTARRKRRTRTRRRRQRRQMTKKLKRKRKRRRTKRTRTRTRRRRRRTIMVNAMVIWKTIHLIIQKSRIA